MAKSKVTPSGPPYDEPKIRRIRKTYEYYLDRWGDAYDQIDLDLKCLSLEGPWPDNERKMRSAAGNERPCLHEDVISQFNNTVINQCEMNPMGIDVQPTGEGADRKSADFVESRIRQVEYEQNGQHSYLNAVRCAVESSIGFWELETDWVDPSTWHRQIRICPILDPKSVLYDPDCKKPDWSDAKGAFKLSRLTHDEFRQKYRGAQIRNFDSFIGNQGFSRWLDQETVQVAAHWYVDYDTRNLLLLDDDTDEGWTIFEDELPKVFKKRGKVVRMEEDGYAQFGWPRGREFPIQRESKRQVPHVQKCVTNGLEILEETDWEDEEIPILVVTGRVRFEGGTRTIESQTRKARTGQLLYDLCISSIQEETARVPKFLYMGYEGQFDTSTKWSTVHREPVAFAEVKATTDEVGSEKPLPLPELMRGEPQIAALLQLKESILISIQNVLGIASTERKDKAAKSGKAIEAMEEDMNVATYHYHNSLRMAQLRQYRIINRLLPKIENTPREVGLRDNKGNYATQKIGANHYESLGRHEVVISSAKYYQSLQEEQSEFADSLLKNMSDPTIMLAVLPDAIRMKGLGPFGDDLAQMIEAMQPDAMKAARQKDGQAQQISPAQLQMVQAQAQQQIQAITQERDQLLFEKKAELAKLDKEKEIKQMDAQTKLEVAAINASVKERMDTLDAQVGSIAHMVTVLTQGLQMQHESTQNQLDRDTQANLAAARQQQQPQPQEQPING
jgi:hypothetical protein